MPDYLYENPPLVEVIAEVHWKLDPLGAIPNAAVDPHYKITAEELAGSLSKVGFGLVERLIPDDFPLELIAHKPVLRFRKSPNTWPVYQFGPGFFSTNMVPPYDGWNDFKAKATLGLDHLLACYPLPERFMKLRQLELRYIDAFSRKHGMEDRASFLRKLQVQVVLPRQLLDASVEGGGDAVTSTVDARFPLRHLKGSLGSIRLGTGRVRDEQA